ncbi:MAG: 1,4-dihydroxy-6-naphthoate synthase [Candidatus Eremiobacteraeota bacterium]|nr:1,4-dihydroxy-6-naphthoate synthase [Candidatus Eremiobacteraeota bacterium]
MDRPLRLAYSPCPNDTYIFAALAQGLLPSAPAVHVALEDVETLNIAALKGDYEFSKVSYGAIPSLVDNYRILRAGGALGHGCGPLVVVKAPAGRFPSLGSLRDKLFAIPGERTTAFMLLRLALGCSPPTLTLRFDKIVEAIEAGKVEAGVIIHESRFTFEEHGLTRVSDLGDWWESQTGLPIPLGAVLARRDFQEGIEMVNDVIRDSLRYAREHDAAIMPYVRRHASEMSDDVMRRHIALYVNEYTQDIGSKGERAVRELFKRARSAGLIQAGTEPEFV